MRMLDVRFVLSLIISACLACGILFYDKLLLPGLFYVVVVMVVCVCVVSIVSVVVVVVICCCCLLNLLLLAWTHLFRKGFTWSVSSHCCSGFIFIFLDLAACSVTTFATIAAHELKGTYASHFHWPPNAAVSGTIGQSERHVSLSLSLSPSLFLSLSLSLSLSFLHLFHFSLPFFPLSPMASSCLSAQLFPQGYRSHIVSTACEWAVGLLFLVFFLTFCKDFQRISLDVRLRLRLQSDMVVSGSRHAQGQVRLNGAQEDNQDDVWWMFTHVTIFVISFCIWFPRNDLSLQLLPNLLCLLCMYFKQSIFLHKRTCLSLADSLSTLTFSSYINCQTLSLIFFVCLFVLFLFLCLSQAGSNMLRSLVVSSGIYCNFVNFPS